MNEKQIAFIICADNAQYYNECVWYIEHLNVPEGYSIDILCIQEAESMAEGYNAGMEASGAKYKVYLQQSTFILNKNFLIDILDIFQSDSSIGMIGMRGNDGRLSDDVIKDNCGSVMIYNGRNTEMYQNEIEQDISCVSTISDFLFVTQIDINFPHNMEGDWNLDIQQHSSNVWNAGYKIVVPPQKNPWCYWEENFVESQSQWITFRSELIKVFNNGDYDALISIFWDRYVLLSADIFIREIMNIVEIYVLEQDSKSGIHSEIFDGRSFEECYEYYKWIAFTLRRIEQGYVDEETELLKSKVKDGFVTITAIQKVTDLYIENFSKVYEYFFGVCEEPLVSVVVPVYNGQDFIGETIESILNQTYRNLEVIIIDDASKDNSKEVINSYATKDARIRTVFQEKNNNVCYTGNIGFKMACGKYVSLIGHDDVWKEDKLQRQIAFMEEHPSYPACFSWADIIDDDGEVVNVQNDFLHYKFCSDNQSREQWMRKLLLLGNHFCAPSVCIRKSVIDKVGYYRLALLQLQDWELWLRILQEGKIYIIKNKLLKYRRFTKRRGSISFESIETKNRTAHEAQWIFNHYVWNMKNEEFIKVFAEDLKNPITYSEKEILCEKALLIYEYHNCSAEAHFIELLEDEECRDIFEKNYGLRLSDFYELSAKARLYDIEYFEKVQKLEKELEQYRMALNNE